MSFCTNTIYFLCSHQGVDIDLSKHERCLQKIKKGALPKTPKNITEILDAFSQKSVMEAYGFTLQTVDLEQNILENKYPFYDCAVENKNFSFCVFSSKVSIQLIRENLDINERHILMDATFKTCPVGPFKQLLIMHVRKRKQVVFFDSFLILTWKFFSPFSHF